jgi:hypothetical protein
MPLGLRRGKGFKQPWRCAGKLPDRVAVARPPPRWWRLMVTGAAHGAAPARFSRPAAPVR